MQPSISLLTVCGLEELVHHGTRGVTHVLSILDPDWPDPDAFQAYDAPHRTTLRFHDAIEPGPGIVLPERSDVEAILAFGRGLDHDVSSGREGHLLVHCHMGLSRSTAAMAMLIAESEPSLSEEGVFARLLEIRPQAWPNSRMIGFADDLLGRGGRLTAGLQPVYARQLAARPQLADAMRRLNRTRELELAAAA